MSSLSAPWQNGPYKNQHTEQHKKHVEHQDATDIQKKSWRTSSYTSGSKDPGTFTYHSSPVTRSLGYRKQYLN